MQISLCIRDNGQITHPLFCLPWNSFHFMKVGGGRTCRAEMSNTSGPFPNQVYETCSWPLNQLNCLWAWKPNQHFCEFCKQERAQGRAKWKTIVPHKPLNDRILQSSLDRKSITLDEHSKLMMWLGGMWTFFHWGYTLHIKDTVPFGFKMPLSYVGFSFHNAAKKRILRSGDNE